MERRGMTLSFKWRRRARTGTTPITGGIDTEAREGATSLNLKNLLGKLVSGGPKSQPWLKIAQENCWLTWKMEGGVALALAKSLEIESTLSFPPAWPFNQTNFEPR